MFFVLFFFFKSSHTTLTTITHYFKNNKLHEDDYAPFIEGGRTVSEFCAHDVDPMGVEADHLQMKSLCEALKLGIRVTYLDRVSDCLFVCLGVCVCVNVCVRVWVFVCMCVCVVCSELCAHDVDPMGVEADHLQMKSLCEALKLRSGSLTWIGGVKIILRKSRFFF